MTWSRIQNTELATEAYVLMNENEMAGCQYHNNQHIEEMYQYLEDTDEPYDEALDWVVMFHDVVYDEKPEKEARSANCFLISFISTVGAIWTLTILIEFNF